ncbi:MAG: YceI family protein, partial [Proteobacteria bacterium]|nr:YceI family protein [Pseudomonadota bacterium]
GEGLPPRQNRNLVRDQNPLIKPGGNKMKMILKTAILNSGITSLVMTGGLVLSSAAVMAGTKVNVTASASSFEWKGSKVTGSTHNGTMAIKEGTLEMDGNRLVGGKVVVEMASLANLDLTDKGYNDKLVTHLKSDDFFDVVKYPTSTITIKSSELQKDGSYKVKGDLQIKSDTHPVVFVAKLSPDHKSAETEITLDRTEWNIRYGSGKFFKNLGDKMISDKMEFKVKLVFAESVIAKKDAAAPVVKK